jgi:hypothetical protein
MLTPKTGHNTGRETGKQENEKTVFSQGLQKNYTNAFHQAGLLNLDLMCNIMPMTLCYAAQWDI